MTIVIPSFHTFGLGWHAPTAVQPWLVVLRQHNDRSHHHKKAPRNPKIPADKAIQEQPTRQPVTKSDQNPEAPRTLQTTTNNQVDPKNQNPSPHILPAGYERRVNATASAPTNARISPDAVTIAMNHLLVRVESPAAGTWGSSTPRASSSEIDRVATGCTPSPKTPTSSSTETTESHWLTVGWPRHLKTATPDSATRLKSLPHAELWACVRTEIVSPTSPLNTRSTSKVRTAPLSCTSSMTTREVCFPGEGERYVVCVLGERAVVTRACGGRFRAENNGDTTGHRNEHDRGHYASVGRHHLSLTRGRGVHRSYPQRHDWPARQHRPTGQPIARTVLGVTCCGRKVHYQSPGPLRTPVAECAHTPSGGTAIRRRNTRTTLLIVAIAVMSDWSATCRPLNGTTGVRR